MIAPGFIEVSQVSAIRPNLQITLVNVSQINRLEELSDGTVKIVFVRARENGEIIVKETLNILNTLIMRAKTR